MALALAVCAILLPFMAQAQPKPQPQPQPTRAARAAQASGLTAGGFNDPGVRNSGFNAGGFNAPGPHASGFNGPSFNGPGFGQGGFNIVPTAPGRGDFGAACGRMLVPAASLSESSRGFTDTHKGIDLVAPQGAPIRAAAGGVISYVGTDPDYGLFVDIHHPGGLLTRYGHMSAFTRGIAPGVAVRAGTVIGSVGATGNAHGAHLHFEVRAGGRALDPKPFLQGTACPTTPRESEVLEARAPEPRRTAR